jgi:DNA-binding MarR family transcriptional regulator
LPSAISKRTGISTAAVTGLIDVLEKDGWVERRTLGTDRRTRPIIPTEKAFNLFTPALEDAP